MDDAAKSIPTIESRDSSGAERKSPSDADGRGTRRTRRPNGKGIEVSEGSEGGTVAKESISGRRRIGSAKEVWGHIWHQFSETREKSRTRAYLNVLADLTENAEILVPEMIQPKDFLDMTIHLESFVKEDAGAKEGSAIDYVSNFLNQGEVGKLRKAN